MQRAVLACLAACLAGGCGGQYILTAPDHVAPAGGEVHVVVRLQRSDFFVLALAAKGAAMRFRVADGPLRAAYTDELGYAAAAMPAPEAPGRHELDVQHMDAEGEEVAARANVFVWPREAALLAVDLDALPAGWVPEGPAAAEAVRLLAGSGGVIYLTQAQAKGHAAARARLEAEGYPPGHVLTWQAERLHIVREGEWRLPRLVVEHRLVSQLGRLRETFPKLAAGVCTSGLAAKAFAEAGLRAIIVGAAAPEGLEVQCHPSWPALRDAAGAPAE